MNHPLVYEINTRCWLRELSAQEGRLITLSDVPDSEFAHWQQLGFTHIWLMGVWTTGPRSRGVTLSSPDFRRSLDDILPGWKESDVAGSPFAVGEYKVPSALGGETGLKKFRDELHRRRLKLLLDFVPNHVGLDHPWAKERPGLFVQSEGENAETILVETHTGPRWIAYGKDPNFPAWNDTLQLDYRRADTRTAMIETLQTIAPRCDGVRCDMTMLLLNDVFAKNWEKFPCSTAGTKKEFWLDAIQAIKRSQADFLFLGEVYWGLEARLQAFGFDYTYDKRLYDCLLARNPAEVQRHLFDATPEFVSASAHFLENHDEPRIASLLSQPEHRAAALLTFGIPGLRLIHEGQLTGTRFVTPVQLSRRPNEPAQQGIAEFYQQLLAALESSAVGRGTGELLKPRSAWPDNPTAQNLIVVQWKLQPGCFDLIAVNLASHRGQCFVSPNVEGLAERNWKMKDLLGQEEYERFGDDLQNQGLYLDLAEHGAQVFHFERVA